MTKKEFDKKIDSLFEDLQTCNLNTGKKEVLKQIYQTTLNALDNGLIQNSQAAIIICGTLFQAPHLVHQMPFEEIIDIACDLEVPLGILDDDQTTMWQRLRELISGL